MTRPQTQTAVAALAREVQQRYGARIAGAFRIGRSELLDEVDRVDAEIVVVLKDGSWRPLDEARQLAGLAFNVLMDTGVCTRVWPVASSAWHDPTKAQFPDFVCLEPLNPEDAP
jgi:hypothetical protein